MHNISHTQSGSRGSNHSFSRNTASERPALIHYMIGRKFGCKRVKGERCPCWTARRHEMPSITSVSDGALSVPKIEHKAKQTTGDSSRPLIFRQVQASLCPQNRSFHACCNSIKQTPRKRRNRLGENIESASCHTSPKIR